MKKVVFILREMNQGGPARSLLNLLNVIDVSTYQIDLVLFKSGGTLFNDIPSGVNVKYVKPHGLFNSFEHDKWSYLLYLPVKLYMIIASKLLKVNSAHLNVFIWKVKGFFLRRQKEKYDLGMSFIEGIPIYYLAKFINAEVKVGRVPTDYKAAGLDSDFDLTFFKQMDYLFTITQENTKILGEVFPSLKERIVEFDLITSRTLVEKKSLENEGFDDDFAGKRIVTLARIDPSKGIDLAIDTCYALKKTGEDFRWYFVGAGDHVKYNSIIQEQGLADCLILVKPVSNPFPYLRQADIYIQPSQYEGKSNAINEAKAMSRAIIITSFSTAHEIIEHNINGLISKFDPESLAENISSLFFNTELRQKFSEYWRLHFNDNAIESRKIFDLIEDKDEDIH